MSASNANGNSSSSSNIKLPRGIHVQHNGATLMIGGGSSAQLRPQFRRQGSSFGGAGHVSPMAVIVAPNKVDYSVTKGGLRLWAVLIVFIVLCSSLYALFSAKEFAELALEVDGDENYDFDGETDDDADEVATANKKAEKDRTPSKEHPTQSWSYEEKRKAHQPIQDDSTDDDKRDDAKKREQEEEARLADLRVRLKKKARRKIERKEKEDEDVEKDDDLQEEEAKIMKGYRRGKQIREKDLKKDEIEAEEEVISERLKEAEEEKMSSEEQLPEMEIEKEEGDDNEEEKKEDEEVEEMKEELREDKGLDEEAKEDEKDIVDGEEEKDEEIDEEEDVDKIVERKPRGRRKHISSKTTEMPKQICKRKNCPPNYDRVPRMSLLKQIPLSATNRWKYPSTVSPLVEDEDDDEVNDGEDESENDEISKESDDDEDDTEDEVKMDKWTGRGQYKRHAITNRDDHRYRDKLDRADFLVEKHDYRPAVEIFNEILRRNPDSPRAHFGLARTYDIRSETESSLSYLDMAINEYQEVLDISDTPDALFRQAAYRLIDRARFRGTLYKVLQAQRSLIDRYPDDLQLHNDFGLTFLMMGREDDAKKVFENVLKISPENGVAQAYYGYMLKLRGDLENGVSFMRKGLRAAREVIADPRFYYHFGDALMRLGRRQEAHRIYSIATKVGLFVSPYQRSLYNIPGLTARPWWTVEQTTCSKYLKGIERQWTIIREEAMSVLKTNPELFITVHSEMVINGQFSLYSLYNDNEWNRTNCMKTPKTCKILRIFQNQSNCLRSEIKFSLMSSSTRIWPHCGYTNCRLQAHLGLITSSEARIRVGNETRGWRTGRFIIFDDSFEREVWFDGASATKYRLVLVLDLWHPEVEASRRVEFNRI